MKTKNYILLAKKAVETFIGESKIIEHEHENGKKNDKGVFVTIYKNSKLRGCVGTYIPSKYTLEEEIIYNAISAASRDNRFETITKQELNQLTYEVSLINKPEFIDEINKEKLDPKKYGLIAISMKNKNQRSILLPNIEGINTVDEQINILLKKAGIEKYSSTEVALYKFTTELYK